MVNVLFDTVYNKGCDVRDIKQLLKLLSALVHEHRYSHPDAFRKFESLELKFESKNWEENDLLPLQVNLLAVIELLKQKKPTA